MVRDADDDTAGEVERDDHQRRNRVALDEFAGAVHRAVKIGFPLDELPFAARSLRIQGAGVHVRVDGHLLSRHCIQGKTCRHFRNALRTAGDDDELNRDENRKNDRADDEVSIHDERAEGRNDAADRARRGTLRQDQARCRDVEREPEERRYQQRRREGRELQRLFDGYREQQDQRRAEDVDGEQHVEQPRRKRNDQNADDRKQERRERIDGKTIHRRIAPERISAATTSATAT